jgi:primosomal protein N' (replication factor Y)
VLLPKVARIAVEQTAFHFDKLYDYVVPDRLGAVPCGSRVLVPFGGGNRRRQGIVLSYEPAGEVQKLKPVIAVLDARPLFNEEMLELIHWLKERTFCTYFDAVRAMLPTGLYMRIRPVYRVADDLPEQALSVLSPEEKRVWDIVSARAGGIDQEKLLDLLGAKDRPDLPESLVKKGFLRRDDDARRTVGDATMRMVRLTFDPAELDEILAREKCTEKQKSVLRLLADVGCASVKEVGYFCSVTAAVIQALDKKGLTEYFDSEVLRSPHRRPMTMPAVQSARLNEEQQAAFDQLLKRYRTGQSAGALLYGVTGSGKTQVYMNLIDQVIADGRGVLVLVPEISLTPQMMDLFWDKYGGRVAVLHSGLAIGERMDEFKRIQRGDARIVVGTRSAIFAPMDDIGLIILDEEQEHTYKSESSPRYHARDVARFRCARHNALMLLSSATPSVESFHAAQTGRYSLHKLTSRYGAAPLPRVTVADRRLETADTGAIGEVLKEEMTACLQDGRQVILLLNRRGYHTHASCRSCGYVFTCPSCSISMTYHRANGQMVCHYCGHMQPPPSLCPECGSDKLQFAGLGTQRVEQELNELFPEYPVLRMDTDTTMSRYAYEDKFNAFRRGDYRIMIGTQMVAKGLDFPNVGLVGVLSADQALYSDDFRAYETTFSLLTQVIGRAGRRENEGKAVIQTYTPDNPVIDLAAKQDYEGFFDLEIASRRLMKYPPYADLLLFGFSGAREQEVREAAFWFLRQLRTAVTGEYADVPVIVLDPTPAVIAKTAGKYRYKILVKTKNTRRCRQMAAALMTSVGRTGPYKSVSVYADINPAGML